MSQITSTNTNNIGTLAPTLEKHADFQQHSHNNLNNKDNNSSACGNNSNVNHDNNANTIVTSYIIKGLISFLSQESSQPLWNYEDITAKGTFIQ